MSSDREIWRIARTISEDSDPFSDYQAKWDSKTVLSDDTYYQVVKILKSVAKKNGCILDHRRIKVKFIPPGFIIKNVYLDCPDPKQKRKLVKSLADSTGDDTIKHTFDDNLRVNLYNAINRSFGDRVREELNLDVTHQFRALPPGSSDRDRAEVMPMITITTPKIDTGDEETEAFGGEDLGMPSPSEEGFGPTGGPEEQGLEGELGAPPADTGETQIQLPGFEGEEEETPERTLEDEIPEPEEGRDLVSIESINRIADLID